MGVGHHFSFHCFVSQQSWENTPRINPKQKAGKVASGKRQEKMRAKENRGKILFYAREIHENARRNWKRIFVIFICWAREKVEKNPSCGNCNKTNQTKQTEMKAEK